MKKLIISIILLFTVNYTYAQDICGSPCFISIGFPEGGSITATDAMEITFGLNGVLDLGEAGTVNIAIQPGSLDFSAGGSLLLSPGESITFGSNGILELGDGGNINANSYSIVASGDLLIFAIGTAVDISGALEAQSLLIDSRTINVDDQNLIIANEVTMTGIDVGSVGVVNVITDFSQLGEGFEWPIDDNTNCIVSGDQCITDSGTAYVINDDGDIVEITDGSGSVNIWGLFLLLMISMGLRIRIRSRGKIRP